MTEAIDRAAIKARAEAAAPGPWATSSTSREPEALMVDVPDGSDDEYSLAWHSGGGLCVMSAADAEFIAHAREDIPALLAALEEAERERDEARDVILAISAATSGLGDLADMDMVRGVCAALEAPVVNDAREQLEVCKDEYGKLERENAELRRVNELNAESARRFQAVAAERSVARSQVAELQAVIENIRLIPCWFDRTHERGGFDVDGNEWNIISDILATSPAEALKAHDAEVAAGALDWAVEEMASATATAHWNEECGWDTPTIDVRTGIDAIAARAAEYRQEPQ